MSRRGVFGGTFDPIHVGHLDVARAAHRALGLARVTVVPAGVPPHRQPPFASAAHRFAMAALAVNGADGLAVSDLEMNLAEPSYTAGTLDRLAARGVDLTTIVLIAGADAFREIATWKDYPAILDRCHIAVVSRPGCPAPALRRDLPDLAARMIDATPDLPEKPAILLVDAPTAPVSSTDVRRRIAWGKPIAGLVPAGVASYIERQGLYAPTGPGGQAGMVL